MLIGPYPCWIYHQNCVVPEQYTQLCFLPVNGVLSYPTASVEYLKMPRRAATTPHPSPPRRDSTTFFPSFRGENVSHEDEVGDLLKRTFPTWTFPTCTGMFKDDNTGDLLDHGEAPFYGRADSLVESGFLSAECLEKSMAEFASSGDVVLRPGRRASWSGEEEETGARLDEEVTGGNTREKRTLQKGARRPSSGGVDVGGGVDGGKESLGGKKSFLGGGNKSLGGTNSHLFPRTSLGLHGGLLKDDNTGDLLKDDNLLKVGVGDLPISENVSREDEVGDLLKRDLLKDDNTGDLLDHGEALAMMTYACVRSAESLEKSVQMAEEKFEEGGVVMAVASPGEEEETGGLDEVTGGNTTQHGGGILAGAASQQQSSGGFFGGGLGGGQPQHGGGSGFFGGGGTLQPQQQPGGTDFLGQQSSGTGMFGQQNTQRSVFCPNTSNAHEKYDQPVRHTQHVLAAPLATRRSKRTMLQHRRRESSKPSALAAVRLDHDPRTEPRPETKREWEERTKLRRRERRRVEQGVWGVVAVIPGASGEEETKQAEGGEMAEEGQEREEETKQAEGGEMVEEGQEREQEEREQTKRRDECLLDDNVSGEAPDLGGLGLEQLDQRSLPDEQGALAATSLPDGLTGEEVITAQHENHARRTTREPRGRARTMQEDYPARRGRRRNKARRRGRVGGESIIQRRAARRPKGGVVGLCQSCTASFGKTR